MIDETVSPGSQVETYEVWEIDFLFNILCEGYHEGELTLDDFRAALRDLMLYDTTGNLWTIGAKTGKWYRRQGERWVKGQPGGKLVSAALVSQLARLESETIKAKLPPGKVKSSSKKTSTLACSRCGTQLLPGAKFCHKCGAPLIAECSRCGAQLRAGTKFCTQCGTPLTKE